MLIKICGMTRLEDALAAAEFGADAVGLNFWRPGKRYIDPERAAAISAALPPAVRRVGVFVDEDAATVLAIARRVKLDVLQFHGSESPEYLTAIGAYEKWKTIRVMNDWTSTTPIANVTAYGPGCTFLLDAAGTFPGGTGQTFDWSLAIEAKRWGQVILAGGLTPQNVGDAIRTVDPWGVDVASGVEDGVPGIKSRVKMREFIQAAREVKAVKEKV